MELDGFGGVLRTGGCEPAVGP